MVDAKAPMAWVIHDPAYVGPMAVIVHVHDSVDALHDWYRAHGRQVRGGGWDWEAVTSARWGDERDPEFGDCMEVHFARGRLWLSIVAHEATHVGLLMYSHRNLHGRRHARAWRHIEHHTEEMPEIVGNLTAHMVQLLRDEYPDNFGIDGGEE